MSTLSSPVPTGLSVLDMQLLHQLGDRIKRVRKARGLGTVAVAQQAGMSRTTLYAVEAGDPNASMGSYLRVMASLGMSGELAMVASGVMQPVQPVQADTAAGRSHRPRPAVQVLVSTDTTRHQVQDLQSLALHAAAVRLAKADASLREQARQVVQKWLQDDPTSRSAPLWQEWQTILETGAFRRASGRSVHAQQLRQASPLTTVLPPDMRQSILKEVSQLKAGLVLGAPTEANAL